MRKYPLFFLICFLPRLAYLWAEFQEIAGHRSVYRDLYVSLLQGRGFSLDGKPTTAIEPLYPLFLALLGQLTFDHLFWVLALQAAVCSVAVVYLYRLSVRLADESVGKSAVILFSFYPYFIRQSVLMIEVSFYSMLLLAAAYYYSKDATVRNAMATGLAFALTLLTRSSALPIWILGVLVLVYRRRFAAAFLVTVLPVLILAPWFVRNHRIEKVILPTRSGINLFQGNCEYSDKVIPAYSTDLLGRYCLRILRTERPDLVQDDGYLESYFYANRDVDRFFTEKALLFMKQNPVRALKLRLRNVYYLFYPRLVPFHKLTGRERLIAKKDGSIVSYNVAFRQPLEEWVYSASYGFIALTALAGMAMRRKQFQRDGILWMILFSFAAVYSVYWPATRLRAPMDFVLFFYSAFATQEGWRLFRRRSNA